MPRKRMPRRFSKGLTEGRGPDVVIDAAGAPNTPADCLRYVRRGGRVVLVAIYTSTPEFDFNSIVAQEKTVIGTIAYTRADVQASVDLIASGKLKTTPLITDQIGLEEVIDVGFARMMAPDQRRVSNSRQALVGHGEEAVLPERFYPPGRARGCFQDCSARIGRGEGAGRFPLSLASAFTCSRTACSCSEVLGAAKYPMVMSRRSSPPP